MHREKLYFHMYVSDTNNVILEVLQTKNKWVNFILHNVSRDCMVIIQNYYSVFVYTVLYVIFEITGLVVRVLSKIDACFALFEPQKST